MAKILLVFVLLFGLCYEPRPLLPGEEKGSVESCGLPVSILPRVMCAARAVRNVYAGAPSTFENKRWRQMIGAFFGTCLATHAMLERHAGLPFALRS